MGGRAFCSAGQTIGSRIWGFAVWCARQCQRQCQGQWWPLMGQRVSSWNLGNPSGSCCCWSRVGPR